MRKVETPVRGKYRIVKGGPGVPKRLQFVAGQPDLVFNSTLGSDEDREGGVHLNAMTGAMSFRTEQVLDIKPATGKNFEELYKGLKRTS